MLTIVITPTALNFPTLTDELHTALARDYDIREKDNGKGHKINGTPEQLFKIMLKLSYTYDIELV